MPEISDTRPVRTEIHCTLPSESMQVLERALQSGRVLSLSEALEFLAAEYLARRPLDEQALEEQREQSRKDLAAQHDRDRALLEKCPVRDMFEATVAAKTTPARATPTRHISLTDFVLFPNQAGLHSIYKLYDLQHKKTLGDLLERHYLDIAKFQNETLDDLGDPLPKQRPSARWPE